MQKTTLRSTSLTATAFFLIGTLAVAQAPSTARKKLPGRMKSGQLLVTKTQSNNGSGATTPQSTQITQRKDGAVTGSGYIQGRVKSHSNSTNNRQQANNPLYEDHGMSGTNPMYEGHDKSSVNAPHYDGDPDRPMDIKQDFGQVQANKHAAGVKYNNRTAAGSRSSSGQSTAVNPATK